MMFEFLFLHPYRLFARGEFLWASGWPGWLLAAMCALVAVGLGWYLFQKKSGNLGGQRWLWLAALQALSLAVLLVILWRPALRVTALKPQQNVVAVVVDDSTSMRIADSEGAERIAHAKAVLNDGLLEKLRSRFQVRLYRAGAGLERVQSLEGMNGAQPVSQLGEAMRQMMDESASLPIGAVLLLSDGSDNAGGLAADTLNEIRRRRIPIHTVGFGSEKLSQDLELVEVDVPQRALSDSKVTAAVTFRQNGFSGKSAKLTIEADGKVVSTRDVKFAADDAPQTETLNFPAGLAGARNVRAKVALLEGEANSKNNQLTRLINVESRKPRILYVEGEPKWDFKFLRRALEGDRNLQLTTLLRTTQNKIYRQGVENGDELKDGFPAKEEELFTFSGLIVGGVEASWFTARQQQMIRDFADRRGGGVLFLGGRNGLSDGGYQATLLNEILPVTLSARQNTFHREPATVELTQAGRDSALTRLEENEDKNSERFKKLPFLANYQETGPAKPGATVLMDALPTSRGRHPLLVTQRYGRGRTALFASAGTWRWQMLQDVKDQSHELFWQQMLRWLVTESPAQVSAAPSQQVLLDNGRLELRADVRDKAFQPLGAATVEARILGPTGSTSMVTLAPDPNQPGIFKANWNAEKPGSYVVEVLAKKGSANQTSEETGRDVFTFMREDGVAEAFHAEQNRQLLEGLSRQTGGNYYTPAAVKALADDISYSEAGVTTRETRELWNMPVLFLLFALAKGGEWLLRRKWGAV
ncbi:MAG: glutamine amidotransferase [Bryobacter sp.]|nr:glutamine amidotransferase [Bryobacter sp.]